MADLKLKICGLRDNAQEVIDEIKPHFAGFIYYEKSPRYVENLDHKSISNIKKVGVFVNADKSFILERIKEDGLEFIQLHGDESPNYCQTIKQYAQVIKVFAGNNENLNQELIDSYFDHVDYYLFDTKTDKYGGTGIQFDWELLKSLSIKKPVILSGGIDLESIDRIKELDLEIYAIDVNSQFEDRPGLKNLEKLNALKQKLI